MRILDRPSDDTPLVHKLVICTIGGTPEPVIAMLKSEQPDKVIFLPSSETENVVSEHILPMLEQEHCRLSAGLYIVRLTKQIFKNRANKEHCRLSAGQYTVRVVPDAQDLKICVDFMRGLETEVTDWSHRGDDYSVIVDITAGTKCMSAALALVARRWRCEFVYVGGAMRTKDGVGVVVSGKEQIVHSFNPWLVLGYQAIEEAVLLFDAKNYAGAAELLGSAMNSMSEAGTKRELSTVKLLAEAYDAWDRFDHKGAAGKLQQVAKNINDLRHAFPLNTGLEREMQKHGEMLAGLQADDPGLPLVLDLLGNAQRRAEQGRYDDAVARLYRAIEAGAQVALRKHGLESSKVPIEKIPERLRVDLHAHAVDGMLQLGLQDDYRLLNELEDPLGMKFISLELHTEKSPLSARNQSILAHGYQPVPESIYQSLWEKTLQLFQITPDQIIQFPKLKVAE